MRLSLNPRAGRTPFGRPPRLAAARRAAVALLAAASPLFPAGAAAAPKSKAKPRPAVTSVQVRNVSAGRAGEATRFTLVLGGRGFGTEEGDVTVSLVAEGVPDPLKGAQKALVIDSQIVLSGEAAPGTYGLVVKKGDAAIDTSRAALVVVPPPPPPAGGAPKDGLPKKPGTPQGPFYVDFESNAYPSGGGLMRYGLVVRSADGMFSTDPKRMTVQISPAGASDVVIRSATPRRLHVDFYAPEKFTVKGVDVSVHDADDPLQIAAVSTNDKDEAKAARTRGAGQAEEAKGGKAADLTEPEITSTEVIFLHRHHGVGRLKIEGTGFGDYTRPPLSSEAFLMNCAPLASKALRTQYNVINRKDDKGQPLPDIIDQRLSATPAACGKAWQDWEEEIRQKVKLALVPRNVDLRIEQTQILYIDDKLIDVYFEFSNYKNYSEPFRLARTSLTVRKQVPQKNAAPAKQPSAGVEVAANGSGHAAGIIPASAAGAAPDAVKPSAPAPEFKTFLATKEVGLKQDSNLQYHYTVLDSDQADRLFGSGVSKTFYAIQLSVTNRGAKKVTVPLSSIEAEIEWAYMEGAEAFFEQGPSTIAPQPLDTVTAFFDANNKVKGTSARLFNIFDGAATLGSSLTGLFGPGFAQAHTIFTGGLVPGIRKGIGDLSGQQLQNLAGMSWQNVEEVSPNGGSVNKYIFIQRGDQLFGPHPPGLLPSRNEKNYPTKKRIKNISGIELVGFEVIEGEPKAGTKTK